MGDKSPKNKEKLKKKSDKKARPQVTSVENVDASGKAQ